MQDITLSVSKRDVYDEVAQTTGYTGAKMMTDEDDKVYERILTTDDDASKLERFWQECQVDVCACLKRNIVSEEDDGERYVVVLELSSSFDNTLERAMNKELYSFFVTGIIAKWFALANKEEAGEYAQASASLLEGVHRKALYKRRPVRPTY
jgi:hypothetical protein